MDTRITRPILAKVSEIVSEKFREYSLNHVQKYTKCSIQSATGGLPVSVELVHKAPIRRYCTDEDFPVD